uniref:F-box/kelch-repeat protein At3g06240-like n=1 Tax=Nicotiana tabacum TaxID=4097 RepID=A0A1S3ZTT6_TOBAC|nr:PREDICTED: F-box/kelch-repeat protein At3g06240-like [Nicotiana tabacum]
MAMTKFEKLPEEIIVEILSRLPAKLIGQSRCVSKQWCSILSAPKLIKAHLTFHSHKYEEEKLITVCRSQSLHALTFNQNGNGVVSRKLDFQQQLSDNWVTVGGSCNGLVLAVNDKQIAFLINPTTLEFHRIPDSANASIGHRGFRMYGLGYDVRSDDYKVVALSYYATGIDNTPDIFNTSVAVYSVRKGLWRRLLQSKESLWGRLYSNDCAVPDRASGVSVKRAGPLTWQMGFS